MVISVGKSSISTAFLTNQALKNKSEVLLVNIGILPNKRGFFYLRELITMDARYDIKQKFCLLAALNQTTVYNIEKDIRMAIQISHDLGKLQVLNDLLGSNLCCSKACPTSKEVICLLSDYLASNRYLI